MITHKKKSLLLLLIISLSSALQGQSINVLDTDFSKGRLTNHQTISLDDVVKFHGHLCDGLVVGYVGISEVLYHLFADSIIDRTNLRVVSRSSPCLADIGLYVAGARYQYNTFYVSDSIPYLFIVQRINNAQTFGVRLNAGVKPAAIDSLGNLANAGKLQPCEIEQLRYMENAFAEKLLTLNPKDIYTVDSINNFEWKPTLRHDFLKTDVVNKALPNCTDPTYRQ